jgi:hypothetical protein
VTPPPWHDDAVSNPIGLERIVVMLMQAVNDTLDLASTYRGPERAEATPLRLAALEGIEAIDMLLDCDLGRLNRERIREFLDWQTERATEGGV